MVRKIRIASIGIIFLLVTCVIPLRAEVIKIENPGNGNDIQPAAQLAVDRAKNGDVIEFPAGQFVVNKSIVVTRFISFRGQGLSRTILYRSEKVPDKVLARDAQWHGLIRFVTNSAESSHIIVSGICFRSKKPSLAEGDGLSLAGDIGIEFTRCFNFIVTGCRFEYFGNTGINVVHDDDQAGAVIFKNEFIHNAKGKEALGLGYGITIYGTNTKWVANPRLGSSNFIFIEDNIFDYHRHSVAAGGCALYVFRHNTVLNNIAGSGGHAIDVHAARGPGHGLNTHGTRAVEIYNNEIKNSTYRDGTPIVPGKNMEHLEETGINIRSGDALVFNNHVSGYRFAVGISNYQLQGKTPDTYPVAEAPGYLSGLSLGAGHSGVNMPECDGDLFVWNNTFIPFSEDGNSRSEMFYNFRPELWKEGRDYHLVARPGYKPFEYPHPLRKWVSHSTEKH